MIAPLDLPDGWHLDGDHLVRIVGKPVRISIITFGLVEAIEITYSPWPDKVAAMIEELRSQRLGMAQMRMNI